MTWRAQMNDKGVVARYRNSDTGETITAKEYERRLQMQDNQYLVAPGSAMPTMTAVPAGGRINENGVFVPAGGGSMTVPTMAPGQGYSQAMPQGQAAAPVAVNQQSSPLVQSGAQIINGQNVQAATPQQAAPATQPEQQQPQQPIGSIGTPGQNMRLESSHYPISEAKPQTYKPKGFIDPTSVALMIPTLVILAIIIAAAHKKRLFPWQTVRTFNPPSGLMTPREYERSYLCPPNLRKHGRLGKRNPNATWTEDDGIVLPFGFLARTHLPITVPLGRLPNKNMFMVAPSGSGKTTLMRSVIKALLAKPCVIIALEAKANDPDLDEKKEGFKYTVLPEAQQAGFETLYFNPLDNDSIHWNPLDLDPITFSSSIVRDVNSLPPEEQHWAERDHGYITGLATLLKWGAVQVSGEDENGVPTEIMALPCNPRGLMKLVNNRRNIVESLRHLKNNPDVDPAELSELTQTLSSIIRTDSDWDKNIQGVRGRLRMFKNAGILRVTEQSNIDVRASMHKPTVFIFGAPASLGPDAESLAACFVHQLEQALHTRYGTASVLPLFAFFDEYQTLNIDIAGKLSAIVRGANGGLAVILQNITQIAGKVTGDPTGGGGAELKTIFSNSAIRICLHNADESTARFFSEEIGKHAVIVPGIADQFNGDSIFPVSWRRIHSQQVVARVDSDSIKRMEKHHALVYMAPAGDSEFGETKPFMVDLRGIEEIARLHLLYNVTNRSNPPAGAVPEPGLEGEIIGGTETAEATDTTEAPEASSAVAEAPVHMPPPPSTVANDLMAAVKGEAVSLSDLAKRGLEKVSNMASEEAKEVDRLETSLLPPKAAANTTDLPPSKSVLKDAVKEVIEASTVKPVKETEVISKAEPAKEVAETKEAEAAKPKQTDSQKLSRICPYCAKQAGKGRFCIECGKELGLPDKPHNGLASLDLSDTLKQLKIPAQPATTVRQPTVPQHEPGFQPAETKVTSPVASTKSPVTTLHEDPFRRIPRPDASKAVTPPANLPNPDQLAFPANAWFAADTQNKVEF